MTRPFLSIIIVNYGTYDLTAQTVASVWEEISRHEKILGDGKVEIIVVDNCSPDDSGEKLRRLASKTGFIFVKAEVNAGFASGNYVGYGQARGEVILLLNSDTVILPGTLAALATFWQKDLDKGEKLGVVACQLRNHTDGYLQPQGGDRPDLLALIAQWWFWDDIPFLGKFLPSLQHTGRHLPEKLSSDQEDLRNKKSLQLDPEAEELIASLQKIGWVGGTAMSFRRELVEKVGFLDTKIFMYGEDMEFCTRVWQKTGFEAAVLTSAPLIHYGSASSSSQNALLGEIKGNLYIWKKLLPAWQLPCARFILFTGSFLRWLIYLIKGDKSRRQTYATALKLVFTYSPTL